MPEHPSPHLPRAFGGDETPLIAFEKVSRHFPGSARPAVEDVSFALPRGRITGIIGPSGAGKSTLVRLINGLEKPDRGRITLFDADLQQQDAQALRLLRRRVGMIFQSFGLLSSATVADNITLPFRLIGAERAEREAKVADLLDRVGLNGLEGRYPAQLSGGQKQRVGIARALATDPEILLCDEATSALDPETTRAILRLLDGLNRELGLTIVMVTHEMEVIRDLCDDVLVLHDGKVVEQGVVQDVFLFPQHVVTQHIVRESDPHLPLHQPPETILVRATLTGAEARSPLVARIARDTGVDISLLDGRIGRLRAGDYSQLLLAIGGERTAEALAAFEHHATIERLNP
jgi:D-methionine transport system ATP-binding protein